MTTVSDAVKDARYTLQNGACNVLSAVQQNKTARRVLPAKTRKMMKEWNRRLEPRRTPMLPIVLLSVGLSAVGTVTGIVVSRYLAGKRAEQAEIQAEIAASPTGKVAPKEEVVAFAD